MSFRASGLVKRARKRRLFLKPWVDYSSESSDYEHCTKKSRDEIQVAPQTSGPQTAMARSPQARVAPLGSTSSSTPEVSSIGAATATALRSPSEKRKPPGPTAATAMPSPSAKRKPPGPTAATAIRSPSAKRKPPGPTAATAGRRRRRQPPPQQSPSISTMPNSTPTSFSHTQSSQPTSSPRTAPPPSPPHSSDNDDDNDEDRDDYNTALQSFSKKWLSIQLTHKTSASATNTFWKAALESLPKLLELKVEENIRKNVPTFVHQRRKLTGELCPDIHMTYVYRDKRDGSISTATVPKRNEFYEKLYEEAHIKAADLVRFHRNTCSNNHECKVKFSLDGVQEARSSIVSTDVFSISFNNCRNVYPIRLIRPCDRFKYNEQEQIREVVNDINNSEMSIDTVVLDKPKRSVMKNVYGHSSTYPCEYCESPACPYRNQEAVEAIKKKYESQRNQMNAQIDSLRNQPGSSAAIVRNEESIAALQNALIQLEREEKSELKKHRTQLTWPASTMNGRPRTVTSIRRIVNDIEESELPLDKHYVKGIKGRSVLMDQPNFDMITDSPCEYMHSVCLGAVKRLVELSFKVGENRSRITTRKLSCPTLYNNLIKDVRVPREFSRRCRKLDLSVFKAQDFRNLLLFFFPIVLSCIPQKNKKEIQLWLCLVYIIRACILPQQEYEKVSQHTLFELCELFYNLFEELFGPQNCTYSIQVVSSHILKIRGHVPLTERSAFMFESYYSEMKNLFQPGTQAPLKQILKNTIMKRSVEYHACAKSVHYTTEKNNLENNHGVYTLDNDNNHLLHNIVEVNNETGSFTCVRQGKFKYCNDLLPNSNWSHVGVYKLGPTGCETYTVAKKDVCGKVLTVNNMLITCPINVLLEN